MKRRLVGFLLAAAALGVSPFSLASQGNSGGDYPVQVQFDACEGHNPATQCEYQEQVRRQAVLVSGVCLAASVQQGTRPVERLYCEPYPELNTN
jgi:hypothetical protein